MTKAMNDKDGQRNPHHPPSHPPLPPLAVTLESRGFNLRVGGPLRVSAAIAAVLAQWELLSLQNCVDL